MVCSVREWWCGGEMKMYMTEMRCLSPSGIYKAWGHCLPCSTRPPVPTTPTNNNNNVKSCFPPYGSVCLQAARQMANQSPPLRERESRRRQRGEAE